MQLAKPLSRAQLLGLIPESSTSDSLIPRIQEKALSTVECDPKANFVVISPLPFVAAAVLTGLTVAETRMFGS